MKHNTRYWAGITAGILSLAGCASAATLGSEKYTYDSSGNIIEKSIDGVVTHMAYDQANRLIGRQADGLGKQTTDYDAAGRPVTERNADDQTTRNLSYGYGDKVLETQGQDSKAGFYYNAEGQLVGKKSHGKVSTYTWDGNVLAADGIEAFTNEAHFSGGVPLLNGGKDIVISDYLGNTLASGLTQFTSTAYGEGLEDGRFTGKMFVRELDSYAFHHRLYSPASNRWAVADPRGFPDGTNAYVYASDPLTQVDPLGTLTFDFKAPDPETDVMYGTPNVTITAYAMEERDQRSIASALIATMNEGLDPAEKWAVTVSTYAMGGDVSYSDYLAKKDGDSLGGAEINLTYSSLGPLTGDVSGYSRHVIQTVYTNAPKAGKSANTSYLDTDSTTDPFYPYASVPTFYDWSTKFKTRLKAFGGSLDRVHWTGDNNLVAYDDTTGQKAILMHASSSFKWSWAFSEN